jgi:hypothetical protein
MRGYVFREVCHSRKMIEKYNCPITVQGQMQTNFNNIPIKTSMTGQKNGIFQASGLLEAELPIQQTQESLNFPGKWVIHVVSVILERPLLSTSSGTRVIGVMFRTKNLLY